MDRGQIQASQFYFIEVYTAKVANEPKTGAFCRESDKQVTLYRKGKDAVHVQGKRYSGQRGYGGRAKLVL